MKLFILKWLLLPLAALMAVLTRKERWGWMTHFLLNSGKARDASSLVRSELHLVLNRLSMKGLDSYWKKTHRRTSQGYKAFMENTPATWEGHLGFKGKPELFYTLGGFTADITFKKNVVIIEGEDRYDWHPDSRVGWRWSPLPYCGWAERLFGGKYFSASKGISNQLWFDMVEGGVAAEFTSKFKIVLSSSEYKKLVRKATRRRNGVVHRNNIIRIRREDYL